MNTRPWWGTHPQPEDSVRRTNQRIRQDRALEKRDNQRGAFSPLGTGKAVGSLLHDAPLPAVPLTQLTWALKQRAMKGLRRR
jgi:hypothetical protein